MLWWCQYANLELNLKQYLNGKKCVNYNKRKGKKGRDIKTVCEGKKPCTSGNSDSPELRTLLVRILEEVSGSENSCSWNIVKWRKWKKRIKNRFVTCPWKKKKPESWVLKGEESSCRNFHLVMLRFPSHTLIFPKQSSASMRHLQEILYE